MKKQFTILIEYTVKHCTKCPYYREYPMSPSECRHPKMIEKIIETGDAYCNLISIYEGKNFPDKCPELKNK